MNIKKTLNRTGKLASQHKVTVFVVIAIAAIFLFYNSMQVAPNGVPIFPSLELGYPGGTANDVQHAGGLTWRRTSARAGGL